MISVEKKDGRMVTCVMGNGDDVVDELFSVIIAVVAQCELDVPGSRRKVPRIMARWLRSREFQDDVDVVMKREAKTDADNESGQE